MLNSVLDTDLRGEHLYINPDFDDIEGVLEWFLKCYRDPAFCTSGTFVLPVWADRSWWRLLKGASVIAYYGTGHPLFTSPDWRKLKLEGGEYAYGEGMRCFRGNTRWPVVVAHFPMLWMHRRGVQCGGVGGAHIGAPPVDGGAVGARQGRRDDGVREVRRCTLQGRADRDLYGLSLLQQRPVR
jgi:hypothetical protein